MHAGERTFAALCYWDEELQLINISWCLNWEGCSRKAPNPAGPHPDNQNTAAGTQDGVIKTEATQLGPSGMNILT